MADGFVTAFNQTSGALEFSTYLGGAMGDDEVMDIATDAGGKIIISGWTKSGDFPTVAPLQSALNGLTDAFVGIMTSNGSSLLFSGLFGGTAVDEARTVVVTDNAIIAAGKTGSADFPLYRPWLAQYGGGGSDGLVLRLDYDPLPSLCGDYDGSGDIDLADAVRLVQFIFSHGEPLLDGHNGDTDCDDAPTIADAVFLVNYIFSHGAVPCAQCK